MSTFQWLYPWLVVGSPIILMYVFREWFKVRLTESVKHEYSIETEKLRSELRQKEILLNEKIESESKRLDRLSSGALTNSATRQEQIFSRRLDAIDKLWNTVIEARKYTILTQMLVNFDLEKVFNQIEQDPQIAMFGVNYHGRFASIMMAG